MYVSSIEGSPVWLYIQGFQVRWYSEILKCLKREVETLTQCSGDSLIHRPSPSLPRRNFKTEVIKVLIREKQPGDGRDGGGRERGREGGSSHRLKVLRVEMLLQLSCIPFHCADANSCKRSPGCSSGFAVIMDSGSYSGMPPAGIFPINYARDELLCGHVSSL